MVFNYFTSQVRDDSRITTLSDRFDNGSKVVIQCRSNLEVKWYNNMKSSPINYGKTLTIANFSLSDSGEYYCLGWRTHKYKRRSFIARIEIYMNGKFIY